MAKPLSVAELTRQVRDAAAAADWTTLAALEPQVRRLAQWAAQQSCSAAELAALAQLRDVHASAYRACVAARQRVGTQMSEMQDKKEGWMAYALHNDTDADHHDGNRA